MGNFRVRAASACALGLFAGLTSAELISTASITTDDSSARRVAHGGDVQSIGDLNADGYSDYYDSGLKEIRFGAAGLRSDAAAIEEQIVTLPLPSSITDLIAAGDINGDTVSDLMLKMATNWVVSYGRTHYEFPSSESAVTSDSGFALAASSRAPYAVGDLNGDGVDDFMIYWGTGYYCFTSPSTTSSPTAYLANYAYSVDHGTNAYFRQLLSGDMFGIGKDAVGHSRTYETETYTKIYEKPHWTFYGYITEAYFFSDPVYRENAGGNIIQSAYNAFFSSSVSGGGGSTSFRPTFGKVAVVGDVNQDGISDYAAVLNFPSAGSIRCIFAGPGSPDNQQGFVIGTGQYSTVRPLGDFDGDGFFDFLALDWSSETASVVRGTNSWWDANFPVERRAFHLPAGSSPGAEPIGDLDGDGHSDFLLFDSSRHSDGDTTSTTSFVIWGGQADDDISATYRGYAAAGASLPRAIGKLTSLVYPPESRSWIGFDAGAGRSLQTVTLHHELSTVANNTSDQRLANVWWDISTDRADYGVAAGVLKYVDHEIAGLNEDGLVLLESNEGPAGPWHQVGNAIFEKDRDTVRFWTLKLGSYIIADASAGSYARVYTFGQSTEGWQFGNPTVFAHADSSHTLGNLDIMTTSAGAFAFWESPLSPLPTGTGIIKASYRVSSDQVHQLAVPVVRFRASTENFELTKELVATSTDALHARAAFSPSIVGNDYEQYFDLPASAANVRIDMDVMNGDPNDAAAARVSLEAVRLERVILPTAAPTAIASYDFTDGAAHGFSTVRIDGWTPLQLAMTATANGLAIQGDDGSTTATLPARSFAFWSFKDTTARLEAGRLYRIEFEVGSDATAAQAHSLPTIRLRINSESLQMAQLIDIEPRNASEPLPIASAPVTYKMYLKSPESMDGDALIYSFDYLAAADSSADPALTIYLRKLRVLGL
ncbi:hypothetical protein BH09SUM1_BH09SUM1_25460 [soil metagenome]